MRVAVFSTKSYDRRFLDAANREGRHELLYFEPKLDHHTARLAEGIPAACVFVNDDGSAPVLDRLHDGGTRFLALRSAGFNHVDLQQAEEVGMTVSRVPAYSPHGVAEHTVGLILALNRQIHRAFARVREGNFSLDGLMGFDLRGRTVGVVGTGKIGAVVAEIMAGFGCRILAFDPYPNPDVEAVGSYVSAEQLLAESDIITLHTPLTPQTHHIVGTKTLPLMKDGVMIVNTSRGALVDTAAVIEALKSGKVGYLGLDVYEEEGDLFFEDLSSKVIQDDIFSRLLTFPNVIITGHQAFFTEEAMHAIATTTIANLDAMEAGVTSGNELVGG